MRLLCGGQGQAEEAKVPGEGGGHGDGAGVGDARETVASTSHANGEVAVGGGGNVAWVEDGEGGPSTAGFW